MRSSYFKGKITDIMDKERSVSNYLQYMLNRTNVMFEYQNLPETIPSRFLELYLQENGNCCITKVSGELYAFTGGLGGVLDAYYQPTIYTVANPFLNFTKSVKIGIEGVLGRNDSNMLGLIPLFSRYIILMAETDISLKVALINSRITQVMTAQNDVTKNSIDNFYKQIEKGTISAVLDKSLHDNLQQRTVVNTGNNDVITRLSEFNLFLKSSMFNDIGLQVISNQKHERLVADEAVDGGDTLIPLIENMLVCRMEFINNVNKMFGTDIKVSLSKTWKQRYDKVTNGIENEEVGTQSQEVNSEMTNSTQVENEEKSEVVNNEND